MNNLQSDPLVVKQALRRIARARTQLLFNSKFVFWATCALHLKPVPVPGYGTMGVDGTHLFFDPDLVASNHWNDDELIGVVAHEVSHCFPAGTILLGECKPIEEYYVNDNVIDAEGNLTSVTNIMSREYNGELVTIRARGMLPLEVTTEHPFLVRRPSWKTIEKPKRHNIRIWTDPVWVNAGDLQAGDWLQVVNLPAIADEQTEIKLVYNMKEFWKVPKEMRQKISLDQEIAEFLGWYVAEGHTTKVKNGYQSGLSLAATEISVAERLQEVLKRRFGLSAKMYRTGENSIILLWSSSTLGVWLREQCGHLAKNKKIPKGILFNTDKGIQAAFLRGYVEGDGSVGTRIGIGTASLTLALQVQALFAKFGVLLNLQASKPFKTTIRNREVNSGVLYRGTTAQPEAFQLLNKLSNAVRPTRYRVLVDEHVLTPIRTITKRSWKGTVYNLETKSHTYTAGNLVTHNCVKGDHWRRGSRHPGRWNVAADRRINPELIRAGLSLPKGVLGTDADFGRAAEAIYAEIDEDDPQCSAGGSGGYGNCGQVQDPDKAVDPAQQQAKWEQIARQAAAIAKSQGFLPAGYEHLIKPIRPQLDPAAMLRHFVQMCRSDDFSWARGNRRRLYEGLYLPSLYSAGMGEILIAADTSASVSDAEAAYFLGFLNSVLIEVLPQKTHFIELDAAIQRATEYEPGDMLPEERSYKGRGGTDMRPLWHWAEENDIRPVCAIVLTDMGMSEEYFGPAGGPGFPVLWVSSAKGIIAPFGETVEMNWS